MEEITLIVIRESLNVVKGANEDNIKTFEDLDVWKVCQQLRKKITGLARKFPKEEQYRLADQLIRSARSVTANIAEGYGRFHYQENIQFCRQARGSLYEVLDHLIVALEESYLKEDEFKVFRKEMIRSISILNGYIRYLRTAKARDEPDL